MNGRSETVHLAFIPVTQDGMVAQTATDCTPTEAGAVPLARDEAEDMAKVMKALADPTRLQILTLIRAAPEQSACVCDLTDPIGFSQPTISHHLKILVDAGILQREKRGAWAWYSVRESQARECSELIGSLLVTQPA